MSVDCVRFSEDFRFGMCRNMGGYYHKVFPYFGGKSKLLDWLLPFLLRYRHEVYVEPFGGSGAVLFGKPYLGGLEVFNDLDGDLIHFFRVLRDVTLFPELRRYLRYSMYSREFYVEAREKLLFGDAIERAGSFFILACQSFSAGITSGWGYSVRGVKSESCRYFRRQELLPLFHKRLQSVQIENSDVFSILDRYCHSGSLVYLDPPYVQSTLIDKGCYKHMFSDDEHVRLVSAILRFHSERGVHFVLSGYENPIYERLLECGWRVERRRVVASSSNVSSHGGVKSYRTECLYMSPCRGVGVFSFS